MLNATLPVALARLAAGFAVACACLAAQEPEGLPSLRRVRVAPGGWLDLDAGVALPGERVDRLRADLRFDRDGGGFFVEPVHGGQPAAEGDDRPDARTWSDARIRLPQDGGRVEACAFVRTDHGVARVTVSVVDPYSAASAAVQWVVVPAGAPVFLPPPYDVSVQRVGERVTVRWRGESARHLVQLVVGDGPPHKEFTDGREHTFPKVPSDADVRVEVRALEAGAVSTPARAVRVGAERPPERAVVEYADRWYSATGGLSLVDGRTATEACDVVFYLYGVYVPGGGVQKVGAGYRAFASLARLPDDGYLPSYGRLDPHDVLAVELPDGRRGAVWLEPGDGSDLRNGMRVHTVLLADGRRRLVPTPDVTVETERRVATLRWPPVDGAGSYVVVVPGRPPIVTTQCACELGDLPPDRVHQVLVCSRDVFGARSLPCEVAVPTFGEDARWQRVTLTAQRRGVRLATGELLPQGDLQLTGGAGGDAVLYFLAPGGWAPMGERAFGDFAELPKPRRQPNLTVQSDESERFFVFDADGGCAAVRVVQRGYPDTVLEYVWLPPGRR